MSDQWQPPRCSHGHILLACPEPVTECPETAAYLAALEAAFEVYQKQQRENARAIVGALIHAGLRPS